MAGPRATSCLLGPFLAQGPPLPGGKPSDNLSQVLAPVFCTGFLPSGSCIFTESSGRARSSCARREGSTSGLGAYLVLGALRQTASHLQACLHPPHPRPPWGRACHHTHVQMRIARLKAGLGLLKVTPGSSAWPACTGPHRTPVSEFWQAPPGPAEGGPGLLEAAGIPVQLSHLLTV